MTSVIKGNYRGMGNIARRSFGLPKSTLAVMRLNIDPAGLLLLGFVTRSGTEEAGYYLIGYSSSLRPDPVMR